MADKLSIVGWQLKAIFQTQNRKKYGLVIIGGPPFAHSLWTTSRYAGVSGSQSS
jgi:hypothetical protein